MDVKRNGSEVFKFPLEGNDTNEVLDFPSVLKFTISNEKTKQTAASSLGSLTVLIIPPLFASSCRFLSCLVLLKLVNAFSTRQQQTVCRTACYIDDIDHSRAFPCKATHGAPRPPPPPLLVLSLSSSSSYSFQPGRVSPFPHQNSAATNSPSSLQLPHCCVCACMQACMFGHSILMEM